MSELSDAQLLRDYTERGDEAAVRELVRRHADMVYAAALRQVHCADLARDVSQSVFIDLIRKAPSLAMEMNEGASLVGWLYRGTRFAALTHGRTERRRTDRERQAMEQLDSASESAPDWEQIGPVLDEAMADLPDGDREALLLRFFQNRDFRTVGIDLGISDDAAQKRVSRALDRLRGRLLRRGVTITVLALGAVLTAQAAPAAPAGLAAALASSALSHAVVPTAATLTLSKAIAMTTLQKTVIAATLALAVGAGIYQARQATQLRTELRARGPAQNSPPGAQLRDQLAAVEKSRTLISALQEENRQLRKENEDLPRLRGEVARLRNEARAVAETRAANDAAGEAAKSWLDRVGLLKQRLQQHPESGIPEMKLVTEQDWLNAARNHLESETDYRQAMSALRGAAENKFIGQLQPAIKKFVEANAGKAPTDLSSLQAFFENPVDPAILQRYHVIPAGDLPNLRMGGDWIITQVGAVDEDYDQRWGIGPNGYGTSGSNSFKPSPLDSLMPAIRSYMAANNDLEPTDPAQLSPYLTSPAQQSVLQKITEHFNTLPATDPNRLEKAVKQFSAAPISGPK